MAVSLCAEAVVQEGHVRGRERPARGPVHLLRQQGVGPAVLRRQRTDDCELELITGGGGGGRRRCCRRHCP